MKKLFTTTCLLLVTIIVTAQLQQDLALKYIVQQPAEKTPKPPVIILLHGYGSNEEDLFELRNVFPKKYLVISARAPYPGSTQGYQWFQFNYSLTPREINDSRDLIIKFIEQISDKYRADKNNIYLLGFSQGAMMCYETGLTNPDKIKGIGVLSGTLSYYIRKWKLDAIPGINHLKIFIAHGTADDRIKFADGKAANEYLKSIGVKPEFHEYPGMGHSISNDVLEDLVKWLQ